MPAKYIFEAVIFDLDGVITRTALVHSQAWKKMFDDYLRQRETEHGEAYREFTQKDDYLPFVDGKPRYEGVKSFLESRGIHIPFGDPSDEVEMETVCGLGNRKNIFFNEVLKREGVSIYESTVQMIHDLKKAGVKIGVASSSKNCEAVLEAAGLTPLIETRVDGVVSAEMGLKGKPEPDIFTTAAANLGVKPHHAIVVEDATSGVAAGRAGNFGLVLGIAREENKQELLINGADIVVDDISETSLEALNNWFIQGLEEDGWNITYHTYEPVKERTREALLTVGNGYMGTRGAMDETDANQVSYPGTYIAGLYNRLSTPIAGKEIWNEDFVNVSNWLPVTFRINDGNWFDINNTEVISIERNLDFRSGLLTRMLTVKDENGNETLIESKRFASMADPHLAMLQYSVKPLNYSGRITFKTGINGALINNGVERYKSLNQQHLKAVDQGANGNRQNVVVSTTESGIQIAEVADHYFYKHGKAVSVALTHEISPAVVSGTVAFDLQKEEVVSLVKKVVIFTSKIDDVGDPLTSANLELDKTTFGFDSLLHASSEAWKTIWKKIDMQVTGDRFSQKLLRLHLYHLMVSMSPHNSIIDASITARGLHGEAYRGHIFWDELFIMPLYDINLPEVAKSMLLYRYRRLKKAKAYAKEYGYSGAMFPWQSGSDGSEETQIIHLNPLNGQWDTDHSSLQRHVSLAVAFNIWQYYQVTGDLDFMKAYGTEMFLQICRFWTSKCNWNENRQRYDLTKVMGPDEFHEQYPDASEGGLNNNAYTNLMVAWAFRKAALIFKSYGENGVAEFDRLGFKTEELDLWNAIAGKLFLDINADGIIAQYEGYFDLKELDWEYYKKKYGNIYRMDRILKAEGLTPDEFKVAKQADMLMTFYNLEKAEVDSLLAGLGYTLPADYLQRNLEYYFGRTSHGSTLSRIVHSRLASIAGNREMSWQLYSDALASDYIDIQGGTTAEGIHAGVMAGTVLIALTTFAGISLDQEILVIQPSLPDAWESLSFGISFKGTRFHMEITKTQLSVNADKDALILVNNKKLNVARGIDSAFTF
ncbi:MAG: beta-phosphoglucomutase family hydrolase [Lentimicrobiaceae bacterium]|jgi:beta-phosphoglucomutase family hydrolase